MIIYDEIRKYPTKVEPEMLSPGSKGIHESLLRGYQILQVVKRLLDENVSPRVISELIQMMETPLA